MMGEKRVMKIEYIFIKKKDDFCNDKKQFVNLLSSNARITIDENEISIGQKKVAYILKHEYIENSQEDMFYLTLQSDADDKVDALEMLDGVIRRINNTYDMFQINTIVDEVSIDYAIRLYPEIAKLENLLRKIIYLFMTKSVGSKWIQKNIPEEMKKSVQKTMEKNQIVDVKEDYLYNADFAVLGWFFFAKYSLNGDSQRLIIELKKEENHTPEKINALLELYEKKSNWERYFSDKIQVENLSAKWNELYKYRNQVAHSKRICKEEYKRACELILELKQAFEDCIANVSGVVMTEEQSEAIEQVAQETIVAATDNTQVGSSIIRDSLRLSDVPLTCVAQGEKAIHGYLQEYGDLAVSDITGVAPVIGNVSALSSGLKIGGGNSIFSPIGSRDWLKTSEKSVTWTGSDELLVASAKSPIGISANSTHPIVTANTVIQNKKE